MSLECLEALNSKHAQRTAVNSLLRFLANENVSIEYVKACIKRDDGGSSFKALMDQFGYQLAFSAGKNGKTLARNTVMSYFRQVKSWLFKEFSPSEVASIDPPLRKMATTLEKYCLKRESGGYIKKAPACTKNDLRILNQYLYANATTAAAYQDATLLCLLWHVFGRASDLTLVQKQNLSVSANNVVFLRLVRMKTSEEQGLTLFPDNNLATCPTHAVALALLMQQAPSAQLLDRLSLPTAQRPMHAGSPIPLAELLEHGSSALPAAANETPSSKPEATLRTRTFVNRLLARVAAAAGVNSDLSSHSFRRGGAQHANSDAQLSAQWIFDRGAWNLSTTNKAFAYVFNTTAEDQKVTKVLSGWDSNSTVQITNLTGFDASTRVKIAAVQVRAFVSCSKLQTPSFNTSEQVLEVLLAHLIKHYPSMKKLNPSSLVVTRLEDCVASAGSTQADLLSWSSALQAGTTCAQDKNDKQVDKNVSERSNPEKHQAAVIEQLLAVNKALASQLSDRLDAIESNTQKKRRCAEDEAGEEQVSQPVKRKQKSPVTRLTSVWFEWYTREPRLWSSTGNRQKKSQSNQVVAFMKLFLNAGFALEVNQRDCRDQVLLLGERAEAAVAAFLNEHGIVSIGAGSVLKHMRSFHSAGALNNRIARYRAQLATGRINDPAPLRTQDILTIV